MKIHNLFFTTVLICGAVESAPILKTAGQWINTAPMQTKRSYHTATLLQNGNVLVAGGYDGTFLKSAEVYDFFTNVWRSAASMNWTRGGMDSIHSGCPTAILLTNGQVLVAGGYNLSNGYLNSAELYDPSTDSWIPTGYMNSKRGTAPAILLPDGKVLMMGGYNLGSGYLKSSEIYDPATGSWNMIADMNTARDGHSATLLPNGKVLVAGGYKSLNYLVNSAELYDPSTNTWSSIANMNTARSEHTATLLPSGNVLVAGGDSNPSAELYDPNTGTWSIIPAAMNTARYGHTATLLTTGNVVVSGGFNGSYISSAEVYTPSTGTWSNTGSLTTTRYSHTAILLSDGEVLVVGGSSVGAIAEIYDPDPVAPYAVTNQPTVITSTSARFSGTVTPNRADTDVSFDYGSNTSYGSNVKATPEKVEALNAATSVSATVNSLYALTTYHYRVKAVNSAGTGYGENQEFTTVAHPGSTELTNGVPVTNQTITADEWKYYYLKVPAEADTLKFVTTGSGDIDIRAQINELPTDIFACNSENGDSSETCQPITTKSGIWWLSVYAYANSTFSVTGSFRQPQTIGDITFNPITLTAGSTTTASATASSGLTVTFTTSTPEICSVNGTTIQGLHIGTCTVTANQAGDAYYIAAPTVSKNITVDRGIQTITLTCSPANITVGTTSNCTATTTSGLVPTVTAAPSGVCTISGNTLTGVTVGTCSVTATQTGNADFFPATTVTNSVPVGKGNHTITLTCNPLSIAVGGTATCTATASSSLIPSLSVNTSICTIANGKTVTGLVAGTCSVKAKQIGNSNYNAATPVTENIIVNDKTYTVTAITGIGGTVTPATNTATHGTSTKFTVTADTDYIIDSTVGGTCSVGNWDGNIWTTNIWTTGNITTDCNVSFNFISVVNGKCGTANGSTVITKPTNNLCSAGTPSTVTGTGPWTWTCNGITTANCSTKPPVNAWLDPPNKTVIRNQPFTLDVTVKSDSVRVGSYIFNATLDTTKLILDTTYQSGNCIKGICPGKNALSNHSTIVNTAGNSITLTGSDNAGVGPGNDLELLVIHFKTKLSTGNTPVTLTTSVLSTPEGESIGTEASGANIRISYGLCGDSDGNLSVNIIDALAIARQLVGLPPPPTIDNLLADTNKNGRVDITDALFIARYAVGLVLPPESCNIGQEL